MSWKSVMRPSASRSRTKPPMPNPTSGGGPDTNPGLVGGIRAFIGVSTRISAFFGVSGRFRLFSAISVTPGPLGERFGQNIGRDGLIYAVWVRRSRCTSSGAQLFGFRGPVVATRAVRGGVGHLLRVVAGVELARHQT